MPRVPGWRRRVVAGRGVRVGRRVRVAAEPGARVVLEAGCRLGDGCRIEARGGTVRIGRGASVGERAVLVAECGIDVGAEAVVGGWAAVLDAEPTWDDPEVPTRAQPRRAAPVTIGDGAVVGPHAAVGPGVTVPVGAVVEPYAVLATPRSVA